MRLSLLVCRAAAVAGAAVLAVSAGVAATAATAPTPTMIVLQPIPVSYGDMQTTVQGLLEVQSSTPSQRLPVPGETITVSVTAHDGTTTALGTATTGSDGTFSLPVTLPTLGLVRVVFAGDSAYAPFNGGRYASPAYLPTRVTLDPLPATVAGMTDLIVTGSAQVQAPDGTWVPAPDTSIIVHGNGTSYRALTQTGTNGQFSTSFWVEDPGPFEADGTAGSFSFAGTAQSPTVPVTINPTPTRVTGLQPTSTPVIAQNGLGFTAHVDAWATNGGNFWTGANMSAGLYFQAQGQAAWTEVATAMVVYPDVVTFGVSPYLPDGQPAEGAWQVRVPATPVFQASESPAVSVPVKIQTWLNNVRLTTSGTAHFLAGTLDDEAASGPLAGQAVKLYYRYSGSATWRYSKTATTSQAGAFALKLPATHRWYEAVFPATGNYLGVQSVSVYYS
jgi:hypothetical protein